MCFGLSFRFIFMRKLQKCLSHLDTLCYDKFCIFSNFFMIISSSSNILVHIAILVPQYPDTYRRIHLEKFVEIKNFFFFLYIIVRFINFLYAHIHAYTDRHRKHLDTLHISIFKNVYISKSLHIIHEIRINFRRKKGCFRKDM